MREILFKAKRIDNGEWVEGSFVKYNDYKGNNQYLIYSNNGNPNDINPETLCEYTGLLDKNGKKIFEGDIVRIDNGKSYKPRYSLLSVDWEINGFYYNSITDNLYRNYDLGKSQTQDIFEVIGNKFDNPELLK